MQKNSLDDRRKVEERPEAWLLDPAPSVSQPKESVLMIKGDPTLSKLQWALCAVLLFAGAIGVPFLLDLDFSVTEHRFAFAIMALVILSVPFLIMVIYPTFLMINGRAKSITLTRGFVKRRSVVIPFDDILQLRRVKVLHVKQSGRMPAEKIPLDLAYVDFKSEAQSIHQKHFQLGRPILAVDPSTMDLFLQFCRRHHLDGVD